MHGTQILYKRLLVLIFNIPMQRKAFLPIVKISIHIEELTVIHRINIPLELLEYSDEAKHTLSHSITNCHNPANITYKFQMTR